LIKFLLLLSASLSLHSALAVPLSSVLEENYYAVAISDKSVKSFNNKITLNAFSYQQFSQSKLPTSLVLLLQEKHDDSLFLQALLCEISKLDIDLAQLDAQSVAKQSYQTQFSTHLHILARQNTLYSQKNSYQAKLQLQQTS